MKIRPRFDFGYWHKPVEITCDELCNKVLTLSLPFVGYVSFFRETRKFSDGLWWTCGGFGGAFHSIGVATEGRDGLHITADILVDSVEYDAAFGDETAHPRIWTDAEVRARAFDFQMYDEATQEFVPLVGSIR